MKLELTKEEFELLKDIVDYYSEHHLDNIPAVIALGRKLCS